MIKLKRMIGKVIRDINQKIGTKFKFIFSQRNILIGIRNSIFLIIIILSGIRYCYLTNIYPIKLVQKEESPSEWVKYEKGDITIYGWKTKRVPKKPNTYFVSYTYFSNTTNEEIGWYWEVNTKEKIVRSTIGNSELEKKYGLQPTFEEKLKSNLMESEEEMKKKQEGKEKVKQIRKNWRLLQIGMTPAQVIVLLGDPERTEGSGANLTWHYKNGGYLWFFAEDGKTFRLLSWSEPYW